MAKLFNIKYAKMANIKLKKIAKMVNYRCMNLRELRKNNNLTQSQAALLVGIPYRTYVRYEENESYKDSYKYKKVFEDLENKVRIDEAHGILSLPAIKDKLLPILKNYKINYCYLFGSYARGEAKPTSDIDLLVDTDITGMAFFQLVEEIRNELKKKIDLLRLKDLQSDNPIVIEILKEGVRII